MPMVPPCFALNSSRYSFDAWAWATMTLWPTIHGSVLDLCPLASCQLAPWLRHRPISLHVRSKLPVSVAMPRDAPGFVEGQPVLDPVAQSLKAHPSVPHIVGDDLVLVEPPAVPLVQTLGEVPAGMISCARPGRLSTDWNSVCVVSQRRRKYSNEYTPDLRQRE
jgi:hypothetical protein